MKNLILLSTVVSLAQTPCAWQWRNPHPHGNSLSGVLFDGSNTVAVGDFGMIQSTADFLTWAYYDSGTDQDLTGITFGGGVYVAVGDSGIIVRSTNLNDWEIVASPSVQNLYDVTYGPSGFVAVGRLGTVLTSTDGTAWTPQDALTSNSVLGVRYLNGEYLAVGANGIFRSSLDGVSWHIHATPSTSELVDVAFNGSIWVLIAQSGNEVLVTSDKANFTSGSIPLNTVGALICDGTTFVACGQNSTFRLSTDGLTWNQFAVVTPLGPYLQDIFYNGSMWMTVGRSGMVATSLNATQWTSHTIGNFNTYFNAKYWNGLFAVMGSGGVLLTSSDGVSWDSMDSATTRGLLDMEYHDGVYVLVGDGTIQSSTDAINWSQSLNILGNTLHGITYGASIWVVVGDDGTAITSDDGFNWQTHNIGNTSEYSDVCWALGKFWAIAYDGSFANSENGVTWNTLTPFPGPLNAIDPVQGQLMVVGDNGYIATSIDGTNWDLASTPSGIFDVRNFDHTDGRTFAVCSNGSVWTQTGPLAWSDVPIPNRQLLTGVIVDPNQLIVAGYNGTLMTNDETNINLLLMEWSSSSTILDLVDAINNCTVGVFGKR